MSNDVQTPDKQAEHAVRQFFQDPRVAQAVVDITVRKKPATWGHRSNAPYYKEFHAKLIKEVIDEMLVTREDQVYFYKDFPHISKDTLYLRINQSLRYLIEKMDTEEHHYAKWCEMVDITRERNVGVRISFREEFRFDNVSSFRPKAVISRHEEPKWKDRMDKWLESGEVKPFHADKLCLSTDEIETVRNSLKPLQGILFKVTSSDIKIVRTK